MANVSWVVRKGNATCMKLLWAFMICQHIPALCVLDAFCKVLGIPTDRSGGAMVRDEYQQVPVEWPIVGTAPPSGCL